MAQSNGDSLLQRRIALSRALNDKLDALGDANICITGHTAQEDAQRQANNAEISDIHLALPRVTQGTFNWPGDAAVATLVQMSAALKATSTACADRDAVINQSAALIVTVRATSV